MKALLTAILLLVTLAPVAPAQANPEALNQLLNEVRQHREREAQVNREREQRFMANRNQQQQMLNEARAELQRQERRANQLRNTYNENDNRLNELNALLNQRTGQFGELFGVVRLVAGEARSLIGGSLVSAEFPDRAEFLTELAASRELPSIDQLEQLWVALLTEMTESGQTTRFNATVMSPAGEQYEADVIRMGVFTSITGNKFLNYSAETGRLTELPRQPESRYTSMAGDLSSASPGEVVQMVIDPSRGALLGMLIQTPGLMERYHQGGIVGYVITAILLFIGLPSFQGSMRSNRVATATNELMSSFALARSEAIRSPGGAAVCSTEDGTTCGGHWNDGWMVWIDMDGDGLATGADDRVLRHIEANPNLVLTMDAAGGATEATTVRFDRLGRRIGGQRTVTVEPDTCPAGHDLIRALDLSPTGQVTITRSNCT